MKRVIFAVSFMTLLVFSSSVSYAVDSKNFTVTATIPAATSVAINAFSVNAVGTPIFTPVSGTTLSFNPMTLNPGLGIFLPDHFFVIDFAPVGGANAPNVTATFTQGANPNSPNHGLGWKSTATFVKVTGATGNQTETGLASHGPKKLLKDLSGENILSSEIQGGFLRIYLGIVTMDPSATFSDPSGSEPFTTADQAGTYDGTLLVSATLP